MKETDFFPEALSYSVMGWRMWIDFGDLGLGFAGGLWWSGKGLDTGELRVLAPFGLLDYGREEEKETRRGQWL